MSYAKGVDYNCTGSTCYGLGTRVDQFRQLQTLINGALARLGLGTSIAIDGNIGSDTVQVLLALVKLPPFTNSTVLARVKASAKPETVAGLVPELLQVFSDPALSFNAPSGTTATLSQVNAAKMQVRAIAPSATAMPASAQAGPSNVATNLPTIGAVPVPTGIPVAPKSNIGWWIAGLTGLAAAGFLLVHVAHRHHDEPIEPPP